MDDELIIKINEQDLDEFKSICLKQGLDVNTAFKTFIDETLKGNKIPFEIKTDSFYSEANRALLKKSIKELEETGGTIHDIDLDA